MFPQRKHGFTARTARALYPRRIHGAAKVHGPPQRHQGLHLSLLLLASLMPMATSGITDQIEQVSAPDPHTWMDFKIDNYTDLGEVPTHDGECMKGHSVSTIPREWYFGVNRGTLHTDPDKENFDKECTPLQLCTCQRELVVSWFGKPQTPESNPPRPSEPGPSDMYEVETIVDVKVVGSIMSYRVKWLNFDESENSWVTATTVNAPKLVREFNARQADKQESRIAHTHTASKKKADTC